MAGLKKIALVSIFAGTLLASGGCMCLPHQDHHQGIDKEHEHAAAPEVSPQTDEPGADDLSKTDADSNLASTITSHHGLIDPQSPWTWLAGAGMAAMMALMML